MTFTKDPIGDLILNVFETKKKMIALDEFCFMQTLKYATYNVVFRDTEVPLDQNGRYCEPQEAVKQGFHTKIRDKANDADFMKLVHEFES